MARISDRGNNSGSYIGGVMGFLFTTLVYAPGKQVAGPTVTSLLATGTGGGLFFVGGTGAEVVAAFLAQ